MAEFPHLDIDEPALCDWLAEAMPGESIRYYRGFLGYDRAPSTGVLPERERKRLVAVASRAM
ncbi:MAG: hypothetical protein HQL34_08975 [Alphaproteobacteria bacterium]|nr:hypothetical protein [Alphaproteobacteria bacterium]